MTELLQKAFDAAKRLSPGEQDALAAMLLDEIESDEHWEASLDGSRDRLETLADEALEEYRAGETEPLDPDAL